MVVKKKYINNYIRLYIRYKDYFLSLTQSYNYLKTIDSNLHTKSM